MSIPCFIIALLSENPTFMLPARSYLISIQCESYRGRITTHCPDTKALTYSL